MSTVALAGKFRAKQLNKNSTLMGKLFKKNPFRKLKAKVPLLNKSEGNKKKKPTTKDKVKATLIRGISNSLRLVSTCLRSMGTVLVGTGFFSLILGIMVCAVLVGGISSALYVVTEGQAGTNVASIVTENTQQTVTASSDTQGKLYEIIDWYLDNVHGYAASNSAMISCDKPWAGSSQKVRPDCSGFATCWARYWSGNMGIALFSSHSGAGTLEAAGFTKVDVSSVNDLKFGDIMFMQGHVEIAMGDGKNFGWGTNRSNSQTFGSDKPDGKYDDYKARKWSSYIKDSGGKVYYGKKEITSVWRWTK